jgi:hypothetical protein
VDPTFADYSRVQQMVLLIQRNAELEISLASVQDVKKLENDNAKLLNVYFLFIYFFFNFFLRSCIQTR